LGSKAEGAELLGIESSNLFDEELKLMMAAANSYTESELTLL